MTDNADPTATQADEETNPPDLVEARTDKLLPKDVWSVTVRACPSLAKDLMEAELPREPEPRTVRSPLSRLWAQALRPAPRVPWLSTEIDPPTREALLTDSEEPHDTESSTDRPNPPLHAPATENWLPTS